MSIYIGAGGIARQASRLYVGVDGRARQVQKVYVGVDGKARLVYQNDTPISSLAVGNIVKIKVDGVVKDFIIVQQGNPDTSVYDASCAGTWLLMKDIYATMKFGGSNNDYKNSDVHAYLNGTFYNLIDGDIRTAIKQVKIPYKNGTGPSGSLATGANGLSTKVFLLSGYEVGWTTNTSRYFPKDGVRLAYFSDGAGGNSKRIAYNGSDAADWWLRSPRTDNTGNVWGVMSGGYNGSWNCGNAYGVRPAMILSDEVLVDESGNILG